MNGQPAMLQPDATLPAVTLVPPPWALHGNAWIVVMRWPRGIAAATRREFVPDSLGRTLAGPLSLLMLVDYTQAPCGPYRELLFVPGLLRFAADTRRHLSISRIVVSTWDSVVNGRANWGIPKDRADFRIDTRATTKVVVADGARELAALEFDAARGPSMPINTQWLPQRWLTLAQRMKGQTYYYTPTARGSLRRSRLVAWRFDPGLFPDLRPAQVLATLRIERFEMRFPVARVVTA
jgi:hypothetical protein